MRRILFLAVSLCLAALAVGCAATARAQTADASAPDSTLGAALRNLASRSGVVFVGRVTAITPQPGVVEVRFAVEQPVLGLTAATYTLREWSGPWSGSPPRYRVGQRGLFFLHPPNVAGLSTPVDGMEGIVPVIPTRADQGPLLDVRRLATRLQRTPETPLDSAQKGAIALSDARSVVAGWRSVQPELKRLPLPNAIPPERADALR
jgi:hypothetical protein